MTSEPTNHARKGHERRDANANWIVGIVAFLAVFGLSLHFILAGFLSSLKHMPPPTDRWRPAAPATQPVPGAPPFPRLQVSPPSDLGAFRAREEAELNTYGWINKTSGVVRVPIERAMELVLQQGLPVRTRTNETQVGSSTYQLMQQRPEHRQPEIKDEK